MPGQPSRFRPVQSGIDESLRGATKHEREPTIADAAILERVTGVPLTKRARMGKFGWFFEDPNSPGYIPNETA